MQDQDRSLAPQALALGPREPPQSQGGIAHLHPTVVHLVDDDIVLSSLMHHVGDARQLFFEQVLVITRGAAGLETESCCGSVESE